MAFHYSPNIITDGLVLYLDAANTKSYISGSTTWNDISRGGNNGVLTNGPTFNSGNGGNIVFDGVNDYVVTSLLPTKLEFTISVWVKLTETLTGDNLCVDDGAGYTGLGFYDTSNKIRMAAFDTSSKYAISTGTITTNQIYNFTGTYKGNETTKLYINGEFNAQSGVALAPTGIGSNTTPIKLFKNGSFYAKGNLYSILLYNRALTVTEVSQNYNTTKSRFGL